MRPVLIPLMERVGRAALRSRGLTTRDVDTPLGPVHVYDGPGQGSLPPVVLLHGIGSSATPFAPLIARLLPNVRRVIAPDYPGHGFSADPASEVTPVALFEAMTGALDRLVDTPALVVGNSLGGAIALHYAVTRPERVAGLVLLSPAGAKSTDEEWRQLVTSFDLRSRAEAVAFLERLYHRMPLVARLVAHELADATMNRPAVRRDPRQGDEQRSPHARGARGAAHAGAAPLGPVRAPAARVALRLLPQTPSLARPHRAAAPAGARAAGGLAAAGGEPDPQVRSADGATTLALRGSKGPSCALAGPS